MVSFWFPYIQPAKSTSFKQKKDRHTHIIIHFYPLKTNQTSFPRRECVFKTGVLTQPCGTPLGVQLFSAWSSEASEAPWSCGRGPSSLPSPAASQRSAAPAPDRPSSLGATCLGPGGGGPGISPRSGGFLRRKTRKLRIQVA